MCKRVYFSYTMGYDWFISLTLILDPSTGKPYEGPEIVEVPPEYRRFIILRGHLFHAYTDPVEFQTNQFTCDPGDILSNWPAWDDVKGEYTVEDYDWSETDHNLLKEALEWLSENGSYRISWSY